MHADTVNEHIFSVNIVTSCWKSVLVSEVCLPILLVSCASTNPSLNKLGHSRIHSYLVGHDPSILIQYSG